MDEINKDEKQLFLVSVKLIVRNDKYLRLPDFQLRRNLEIGRSYRCGVTDTGFSKNGPIPASFCLFSSFSHYDFNNAN